MTKSKERVKATGEIFTPAPLVNELLDTIDPSHFTDPTKTSLDPSCGDGEFLVEVLRRRLQHMSPLEALKGVYGVEIMKDNSIECKRRLREICEDAGCEWKDKPYGSVLRRNIVWANSLEYDFTFRKGDNRGSTDRWESSKFQ